MIKEYIKTTSVKAIKFTKNNSSEIIKILIENDVDFFLSCEKLIIINTKSGAQKLFMYDYLIISDEIYPCTYEYFNKNYMEV